MCTWISMATMFKEDRVEKGIRGEYVMQYIDMKKQIINTRKIMIKTKNHHLFSI